MGYFLDNISDEEFEKLLDDMATKYIKFERRRGSIIYKGKLYSSIKDLNKALKK